jgi:UDP-N-acetylmuramate dehydrogenase
VRSQGIGEELEEIFTEIPFEGDVRFMEPMIKHTSLRIGGPANLFVIPRDLPSLKNILVVLKRKKIPVFVLGGGSNILVRDGGIEGVVISLRSFKKIEILSEDRMNVKVHVEAGTLLQRLVNFSREKGYSGIEGLAGIPGSVGGAICGNAGAFGYEMKDVLISVSITDDKGRIKSLKKEDIDFGYRRSGISSANLLLSAEIILKKDKKELVSAKIEDFLKKKWESQPFSEPSAGCVFKNPPKLSAGKLIDEAGCKGMRIGDAEVSSIHANFFTNKGKAKASDFIRLMENVAQKVKERFGVVLETEIKIVGRDADGNR